MKMKNFDTFRLDSEKIKYVDGGAIIPMTIAAEMVQSYPIGQVYKSEKELERMVDYMRQKEIPLVFYHPKVVNGDEWDDRAIVGEVMTDKTVFNPITHKVETFAFIGDITGDNKWVMDGILDGSWSDVSIGFDSDEVAQMGSFENLKYDFISTNIKVDHVALTDVGRCSSPTCGCFADDLHSDPEVTQNYVRIPVVEPQQGAAIRTITISAKDGIKALIQIINGKSKVVTYLFDKARWTMEKAKSWISEHRKSDSLEGDAVWTAKFINDLPDSSFAYIEAGGKKDEEGKTIPRSLRHLPYKNQNGEVDATHVRNALARLPQTNISAAAKAEARRKLTAAANKVGIKVSDDNGGKMTDEEEKPKDDGKESQTSAKADAEDCSKKIDSLVAEFEEKFSQMDKKLDSANSMIEEYRKKLDSLVAKEEKKESPPEEDKKDEGEGKEQKEGKGEEGKTADQGSPATGSKSVKPSVNADDLDFDAMKQKRQEHYIHKTE